MVQCKADPGAYGPGVVQKGVLFDLEALSSDRFGPSEFIEMFEQVSDGLPEQIAMLDDNWNVLAANAPWTVAVEAYGHAGLAVGGNYREFCIAKADEGYQPAMGVLEGIASLDSGAASSFCFVHKGTGLHEGSVFELCLKRLRIKNRVVTIATRTDISELSSLRQVRDGISDIVIESRAQERQRIARELHDSTMQLLNCLTLAMGRLKRSDRPADAQEIMTEMEDLLGQAQAELRTMAYLAHPPLVAELGLRQALSKLVDGFGRRSGLNITLNWSGNLADEDQPIECAVYRIIQESLSNIYRHARAKNVTVTMNTDDSVMEARIADDGIGMPARPVAGVGISGMRARLAELDGNLTVRSSRFGTQVIAVVPRPSRGLTLRDAYVSLDAAAAN